MCADAISIFTKRGATPKVTDPKISEPIPARKMPKVDEGPRYMTFPLLGNLSNDLSDDGVHPPYNRTSSGHVGLAASSSTGRDRRLSSSLCA